MSIWARVGAKVVCINDGKLLGNDYPMLARCPPSGGIYVVAGVIPDVHRAGLALIIRDYPNTTHDDPEDIGWCISRFRPLVSQADDIAMFRELVEGMKPTERLDIIAEKLGFDYKRKTDTLNTTPS